MIKVWYGAIFVHKQHKEEERWKNVRCLFIFRLCFSVYLIISCLDISFFFCPYIVGHSSTLLECRLATILYNFSIYFAIYNEWMNSNKYDMSRPLCVKCRSSTQCMTDVFSLLLLLYFYSLVSSQVIFFSFHYKQTSVLGCQAHIKLMRSK